MRLLTLLVLLSFTVKRSLNCNSCKADPVSNPTRWMGGRINGWMDGWEDE